MTHVNPRIFRVTLSVLFSLCVPVNTFIPSGLLFVILLHVHSFLNSCDSTMEVRTKAEIEMQMKFRWTKMSVSENAPFFHCSPFLRCFPSTFVFCLFFHPTDSWFSEFRWQICQLVCCHVSMWKADLWPMIRKMELCQSEQLTTDQWCFGGRGLTTVGFFKVLLNSFADLMTQL